MRSVKVWAVTPGGDVGEGGVYRAIIDTGATRTVVPRRILRDLGHSLFEPERIAIEGRRVPVALFMMEIESDGGSCQPHLVAAAVSDIHAKKAGEGIILGHDYLQAAGTVLRYNVEPHAISCPPPRRRRR